MAEQDATEPLEEATEPEPESDALPAPLAPVLESDEPVETTVPLLEEEEATSEEEPPPPPKRVRKARVEPEPKAKAEPKRRGRPPGSRNIVRAPAPVLQDPMAAPLPAQSAMELIMTSMRERRQAHQERQHTFFQSFLP